MFKGTEFKLIVAGGRDFEDYRKLSNVIHLMSETTFADRAISIISGMAKGADSLAVRFAREHNVQLYEYPANWLPNGEYDKTAGFKRNHAMADFADGLLAFWDNKSRGTAHMITCMQTLRKPVHIVNY